MVQPTFSVIKTKQKRTDGFSSLQGMTAVAKSTDHAVGAAKLFDLLHAFAVAGLIGQVDPLGDDAVISGARFRQPLVREPIIGRRRGQSESCLSLAVPSRSKAMNSAGVSRASFCTRLAAG